MTQGGVVCHAGRVMSHAGVSSHVGGMVSHEGAFMQRGGGGNPTGWEVMGGFPWRSL